MSARTGPWRLIVWSSLKARRARLVLALTAVTLGVAVATALATLALQVGDDLARTLRGAGPNFVVLPEGARLPLDLGGVDVEPARAGLALPDTAVADLKRSFWKNNVLEAAPELTVAAVLDHAPVTLVGTWFAHDVPTADGPWRTGVARLHPHWTLAGAWPREDADELVVGRDLAGRLALHPGATIAVAVDARREIWRVTGIVDAAGATDDRAWAPLAAVQRLAGRGGELDRVWVSALTRPAPRRPAPDAKTDPAAYERYMCTAYPANLARDLGTRVAGAEVLPLTEVVAGESLVVGRLNLLMLLLALAALAASTLGLLSTTTATVVERSVELGLLRAIGASSPQIAALLLGENGLIAVAGGALGWAAGGALAIAIRGQTFGRGETMPVLVLPLAIVLALVVATLGTLGPLRLALRLDPATVLRG